MSPHRIRQVRITAEQRDLRRVLEAAIEHTKTLPRGRRRSLYSAAIQRLAAETLRSYKDMRHFVETTLRELEELP